MELIINTYGYQQAIDEHDDYVCVSCHQPYTNMGDGLICQHCDISPVDSNGVLDDSHADAKN